MIEFGITILVLCSTFIIFIIKKRKSSKPFGVEEVLVLHQLPRGRYAPSLSPFPLKLETYLRKCSIQYKNDFSQPFSPKGKTPWISYMGKPIYDSQFCVEFLNHTFDIDLNSHLTDDEKGVARAFQKMIEENLYWCLCADMFGPHISHVQTLMPYCRFKAWFVSFYLWCVIKLQLWGQGIGRHNMEEIRHIGKLDIQALAAYLGEKPYLMGDRISEVDCSLFGILAQIKWNMQGTYFYHLITDEYQNLSDYCDRMRNEHWTDWEELVCNK